MSDSAALLRSGGLGRRLLRALVVAVVLTAAGAVVLVTSGVRGPGSSPGADQPATGRVSQPRTDLDGERVEDLMSRYRCRTGGFATATPRSAIVRGPETGARVVSFERGWRIFRSEGPSTLVAVCLQPVDAPLRRR